MERYWDVKDDKLHELMVEKAAEKAKKGKKSQKVEEPPEYVEVPFEIRHEIIVEDIRNRRRSFDVRFILCRVAQSTVCNTLVFVRKRKVSARRVRK